MPIRIGSRHSPHAHPFEVVIHYSHYPCAGEPRLPAFSWRRLDLVIGQPDGCCVLLPTWMTERAAAALPMVEVPRPASLLELRRANLRHLHQERLEREEAMMEQHPYWAAARSCWSSQQRQFSGGLDPATRAELASLLKLSGNECSAVLRKSKRDGRGIRLRRVT